MPSEAVLAQAIAHTGTPFTGTPGDFDPLLDRIGDARFVLLGEPSHGTHDFYRLRAELTKRLIREKAFIAVAAEADWPDSYRVNRFLRGAGNDREAIDSLSEFRRFPQWMWRNADFLDFVGWMRTHNDHLQDPACKVGFYGLDVYSLHASIQAVLGFLDRKDPEGARRARQRYECFDAYGVDPQRYGRATAIGLTANCEQEVIEQLVELQRRRTLRPAEVLPDDEEFEAEQNARVVAHAEQYYRAMHLGDISTWNLRDTHMADTLDSLADHLSQRGRPAKIVVWAHNSHVGDSAATQRHSLGELNIGNLCRVRHRRDTVLVGFTTYHGTVTAAADWDAPAERKHVRPALRGSYEALFHHAGVPGFLLLLDRLGEAAGALYEARLQRAIGVVYRPQTERASHYYYVRLPDQFDAVIHLDETRALEPLERTAAWERGELPETYPSGL